MRTFTRQLYLRIRWRLHTKENRRVSFLKEFGRSHSHVKKQATVTSFNLVPPPATSTPVGAVADAAQERIGQLQLCCIHCSLLSRPFSAVSMIVPSKCLCCAKRVKGSSRCLCGVWLREKSWRESAHRWVSLGEWEPSARRQAHQRLNDWR